MKILVICLLFFTGSQFENIETRWKYIGIGGDQYFHFDSESLSKYARLKVRVWVRSTFKNRDMKSSHEKFEQKSLYEIDCLKKEIRLIQWTTYDKNKNIIESNRAKQPEWSAPTPDSIGEEIVKRMCKVAYKR